LRLEDPSDGDTLVLESGSYYDANVAIDKSLTIRAANAATEAAIDPRVSVDAPTHSVTVQGLTLKSNLVIIAAESVDVLENRLQSNIDASQYESEEGDGALSVIGNLLESGGIITASDNAYIAGNTVLDGYINARASAWIVGNQVFRNGTSTIHIETSTSGRILGNRVNCLSGDDYCITSSASSSLIASNIIELGREARAMRLDGAEGIVRNNIVRGTIASRVPSAGAIRLNTTLSTATGNIVVEYNQTPISAFGNLVEVAHNLCFGNTYGCPSGGGNLEADPLFVDMDDYRLSPNSPAIDAGPADYNLADLDRTRNDIGA
jgi:nitrous oxidase accessory protein NosD